MAASFMDIKPVVNGGGAMRPESYDHCVLWTIDDCQHYRLVTEKNASRPPMEKCVCNGQGETISASKFNAIKMTARMLINIQLVPLGTPADPAAKMMMKTKKYYKKYFLQNFKDVLDKLEAQEPLLALCTAHWKAEHILTNCLTAIMDVEKVAKKKNTGGGLDSSDRVSVAPSMKCQRKKTAEEEFGAESKKKQRRNHADSIRLKGVKGTCCMWCDLFTHMVVNAWQSQLPLCPTHSSIHR